MIRDPQFWKRFSVAVHQDDQEKQELANTDLKHSYVTSSTLLSSPLGSPTSTSPLSHAIPPMAQISSSLRSSLAFSAPAQSPRESWSRPKPQHRPRSKLQKTPSTKPLLRPSLSSPPPSHHPSSEKEGIETILSPPQSPFPFSTPLASPSRSFFRTPNLSTFSLSGRPSSRFNFTTTITADASNRDSWLSRQKKKERQRTWLCWCFWGVVLGLVAGVVVAVVVLKRVGVI